MDIWNRYVSPSGYHMNDDGTDSLGVDHSNFSLRDEIAYQMNRVNNEEQQQLILPQASATIGQTPTPWNNQNQPSMFQTQTPTPWSGQAQIAQQLAQNQTIIPRNPDGTMIVPTQTPTPWRNNQTLTPWNGGYDLSGENTISQNSNLQPYIFSGDMRNLLGELESGNNYTKVNSEGGGIGALGRYQIRRDGFKDAGYINSNNQWAGKNDINSADDYLNNSALQEQALDDFMRAKYRQLQNNGSRQYLGYPVSGIVDNFDITDTGLLAASHREGARAVHNYLSHLEKNKDGRYHLNYDKITNPKQREMFKRIETRLRVFEK